jgi:hypothetical protein
MSRIDSRPCARLSELSNSKKSLHIQAPSKLKGGALISDQIPVSDDRHPIHQLPEEYGHQLPIWAGALYHRMRDRAA